MIELPPSTGLQVVDDLRGMQTYANGHFDDPAKRKLYIDIEAETEYAYQIADLLGRQFAVNSGLLLFCPSSTSVVPMVGEPFVGTLRGFGHFAVPQIELDSLCLTFDDPGFGQGCSAEITRFQHHLIRAPINTIVSCELLS